MKRVLLTAGLTITVIANACKKDRSDDKKEKVPADVVISWNKFSIQTIKNKSLNTNFTTRILAIEAIAVYDAVNSILQFGSPYHYTSVNNQSASPEAAAAQAAHDVLCNYFVSQKGAIDSALNVSLEAIKTGDIEEGRKIGSAAAADIIALRKNDGCDPNQEYYAPANRLLGQYRATPPYYSPGINLQWGSVKPFLLTSPGMFRPQPPPVVGSAEYNNALNTVRDLGSEGSSVRTAEQTHIALFYKQDPELTVNETARKLLSTAHFSIEEAAYILMLTEIAEADACIALYDAKYFYLFWRPVTALNANAAGVVTNNYTYWKPLLNTPSHPSYPCGHCGIVNAGLEVLKHFLGDNRSIELRTTTPDESIRTLTLTAIETENSLSRIYAGAHYPFDNSAAEELGNKIATFVIEKGPVKK